MEVSLYHSLNPLLRLRELGVMTQTCNLSTQQAEKEVWELEGGLNCVVRWLQTETLGVVIVSNIPDALTCEPVSQEPVSSPQTGL